MTIAGNLGNIPKKIGIPIAIFWLLATIYIWFIPFSTTIFYIPLLSDVLNSFITNIFAKIICTLIGIFGLFGTLPWTFWAE